MAGLSRRTILQMSRSAGLLAGLGGLALLAERRVSMGPTDGAGFHRFPWPFPPDPWPAGRAWTGNDLDVYVRLKPGLCGDCETGIATDEALDRIVDIDRLDPRFRPMAPGSRIRLTDMTGRARLYRHRLHNGAPRFTEGIAVTYQCDAVIALIDGNVVDEARRKMAHRFLESNTVQMWVNASLTSSHT